MARFLLLPLLLVAWLLPLAPAQAQDPAAMQDHRRRMLELFRRLDHDGDGRLKTEDVRDFPRLRNLVRNGDGQLLIQDVAPMGEPFLGERLMQAFRAADRNGDGQLSVEESVQLPGLHSRFGRFDRNGDGLISIEELLWFRRSLAPRRYRQSE